MASKKRKRRLARSALRLLLSGPMRYRFADCELDLQLYQLRRNDTPVAIEPRVFDVLTYLLTNRERVVAKDELLDKLWPGQVVTETALTRCIAAARKAVNDDSTKQEIIETHHGRGYRFIAEVVSSQHSVVSHQEEEKHHHALNVAEGANDTGSLPVTSNGQASEVVLAPLPLPNAQTGNEHEVSRSPAPVEMPAPASPVLRSIEERRGENLTLPSQTRRPRRVWLRGILGVIVVGLGWLIVKNWSLLVLMWELRPSSVSAPLDSHPPLPDKPSIAVLPFTNMTGDPQVIENMLTVAQKAQKLDDSLPTAHELIGLHYLLHRQYEQAIAEFERAIELGPNWSSTYAVLGWALNAIGRSEEAIPLLEKAVRYEVRYPFWTANYLTTLGDSYRLTGQYDKAIDTLKQSLNIHPGGGAALWLTATYMETGQDSLARALAAEIRKAAPQFTLDILEQRLLYQDPAKKAHLIAVLRKAGLK